MYAAKTHCLILAMTRMALTASALPYSVTDTGLVRFSVPATGLQGELYLVDDHLYLDIHCLALYRYSAQEFDAICRHMPAYKIDVNITDTTLHFHAQKHVHKDTTTQGIQLFLMESLFHATRFYLYQESVLDTVL